MKTLFVSGTDTEVGKTWVSCRILTELREHGHRVGAWKPVCSGAVERDGQLVWEDVQCLLQAIGGDEADTELQKRVCPQRFTAPLAPNIAARLEGDRVLDDVLNAGLVHWKDQADYVLVEGAGGLLSPTSDQLLVADLVRQLNCPLLLVAANRLGVIHQTLATVEVALARRLQVVGLVLNQVDPDLDPTLAESNVSELRRLLPRLTIVPSGFNQPLDSTAQDVEFIDWFG
ncbi:unnamed protein product [Ostreobium quekettii]|uniref:Dethiobiotin synthase n=1 Tax=Ostreobium quekettii TaxID=121088 RepID=A0A8S1J9K9_9CHLO|nr:unnamed protein product [Ostreobium quekettii]